MKKILILFCGISLFSYMLASSLDENILVFEKERFSKNSRVELQSVKVNSKVKMPIEGWYGFIIDIKAEIQGKTINGKDILFSNGQVVTPELLDIKTGNSMKDLLQPKLSDNFYNKEHFILGNINAKDKIVIFSDPLCPFCMDYVPEVINHVKKNSDKIALFYYHFPLLKIHPASNTLTKAMLVARKKGIKDIELKTYIADWDSYFKDNSTDEEKILKGFNKEFKTNITLEEINNIEIIEEIKRDIDMGDEILVKGTPTIFINGEKDNTKLKYETLGDN